MKAKMLALLLAAAMLAAMGGCASKPAPDSEPTSNAADDQLADSGAPQGQTAADSERVLCFAYFPEDDMNPFTCDNIYNQSLGKLVYEGLFTLKSDFTTENRLCKSHFTPDNQTWAFSLRQDAVFHDGQALTARDVVYSLEYSGLINGEIAETGDYTFSIVLSAPNPWLLQLLDIPIVPYGAAQEDLPAGTGPYRLVTQGGESALRLFDRWYGDESLPETIRLYKAYGIADVLSSFSQGEVSVAVTDYGGYGVGASVSCDKWECPTTVMHYVAFNCGSGQCRDPRLRYALQMAMDREKITSDALEGQAVAAVLPVNAASASYDRELAERYAYSPENFAQAMEDMYGGDVNGNGYWDLTGWDVELDLAVNSENDDKVTAARAITDGLDALGIKTTLHVLDWKAFMEALETGDFDLYYAEVRLADDFSLQELLDGSLNYGEFTYGDPWADFYTTFMNRAPFVTLGFETSSVLTRRGELSGLDPVQGNIYYGLSAWTVN